MTDREFPVRIPVPAGAVNVTVADPLDLGADVFLNIAVETGDTRAAASSASVYLTVEQARELAGVLIDAADAAEAA